MKVACVAPERATVPVHPPVLNVRRGNYQRRASSGARRLRHTGNSRPPRPARKGREKPTHRSRCWRGRVRLTRIAPAPSCSDHGDSRGPACEVACDARSPGVVSRPSMYRTVEAGSVHALRPALPATGGGGAGAEVEFAHPVAGRSCGGDEWTSGPELSLPVNPAMREHAPSARSSGSGACMGRRAMSRLAFTARLGRGYRGQTRASSAEPTSRQGCGLLPGRPDYARERRRRGDGYAGEHHAGSVA